MFVTFSINDDYIAKVFINSYGEAMLLKLSKKEKGNWRKVIIY